MVSDFMQMIHGSVAALALLLLQFPSAVERVAEGLAVSRNAEGTPVDTTRYVVEQEGEVVWITLSTPGGNVVRTPAGTLVAIQVALDQHLPGAAPAESAAMWIKDGSLRVGFARSVPVLAVVLTTALMASAVALSVGLVRERRRSALLTVIARHQTSSREQERLRVAREIHDGPVQTINAAAHALAAFEAADGVRDRIRGAALDLRRIASGLRPPALDQFGLAIALSGLAEDIEHTHPDVRVNVHKQREDDELWRRLNPDASLALYRVAQEATQNAAVHGRSSSVDVSLVLDSDEVVLTVLDVGQGIRGGVPALEGLARGGHLGLVGMHERAQEIGGHLSVATSERGTSVTLRVRTAKVE